MSSRTSYDVEAVAELDRQLLPAGSKGVPLASPGMRLGDLPRGEIHAFEGDLPMPLLAIRETALANNIEKMAEFCAERGLLLAPHGKTSMAPQLFARQIDAGAWAITAATPSHARVYRRFGIQRIFFANLLLEETAIHWLCDEMRRDPEFEFFCLVDSLAAVRALEAGLATGRAPRPVQVLLEVGFDGGRSGARGESAAQAVATAAAEAPGLELVGLECFEGLIPGGSLERRLDRIDAWLDGVAVLVEALIERGHLPAQPLISAGGSAFFDLVIAKLAPLPGQLVLRSGCYVTQDGGFYAATSPLAGRANGEPLLRDALELWSTVLSRPESGRAIAGFGARDAPYDMGLPTPVRRRLPDGSTIGIEGATVVTLNDQHAHLELAPECELEVGDLLQCSVSHPCGAFDRWRTIPVLSDEDVVVDAIATFF